MPIERMDSGGESDRPLKPLRKHCDAIFDAKIVSNQALWDASTHIKLHGYFSVPTWKPRLRGLLQMSIRQVMQGSSYCAPIIWKIGAYDGMSESFWIPQISVLSKPVYICSFKPPEALRERFVAFIRIEDGLKWIEAVEIEDVIDTE